MKPGRLTLSEEDRRVLAPWAADCAERVLPLFEAHAAGDSRPREAIDGLRGFADGLRRIGELRALSVAAHAAARAVNDPAAVAAARAAGHAAATAHMAAHARGAPAYAAIAVGIAAAHEDEDAAVAAELRWQQAHALPAVREIMARLPAPTRSAGQLSGLIQQMHAEFAGATRGRASAPSARSGA